jgi:LmbE family N-acetylglucosaminyl deacetylase
VDARDQLDARWQALRAHASQASPYDDLPPDLQREFLAVDRLRLVRGDDVLGAGQSSPLPSPRP